MALPPGVRTSTTECPYQVNVVSRSMANGAPPPAHRSPRRYTRLVPSTQIAQNLAFVNWTVLTGLAIGSYGAVVLLRRRTAATSGFLGFTAGSALVFGLLAWLSDGALPATLVDSPVTDDPAWSAPRATALVLFCGLVA